MTAGIAELDLRKDLLRRQKVVRRGECRKRLIQPPPLWPFLSVILALALAWWVNYR